MDMIQFNFDPQSHQATLEKIRTLSCVKVTHFVYSQIPKNASLLGIFPDFSENFQKSSKIINLNIREQFQKDVFTSGTDRLKSR